MTDTNTDESLSLSPPAAERRAASEAEALTRAEGRVEAARLAHRAAEQNYDESGGTDEAWSAVEACASALARAERDKERCSKAKGEADHNLILAKLADLSERAKALAPAASLDVTLKPCLLRLTELWESLGEAEQLALDVIQATDAKRDQFDRLQREFEQLDSRRKLEHPAHGGGIVPRFPRDLVQRNRSGLPRQFVREQLTDLVKPDSRELRCALLPQPQTTEETQALHRQMRELNAAPNYTAKFTHSKTEAQA